MKLTLTPNQQLLLNGLLTMLGSALVAGLEGVYQYYTVHGHVIDIPTLVNVFLVLFGGAFFPQVYIFVPAHAQQTIAALSDAVKQVEAAQQGLMTAPRVAAISTGNTQPTRVQLPAMPRVSNAYQPAPSIGIANPATQPQGATLKVPMPTQDNAG